MHIFIYDYIYLLSFIFHYCYHFFNLITIIVIMIVFIIIDDYETVIIINVNNSNDYYNHSLITIIVIIVIMTMRIDCVSKTSIWAIGIGILDEALMLVPRRPGDLARTATLFEESMENLASWTYIMGNWLWYLKIIGHASNFRCFLLIFACEYGFYFGHQGTAKLLNWG